MIGTLQFLGQRLEAGGDLGHFLHAVALRSCDEPCISWI